jgi:hypothetical protein
MKVNHIDELKLSQGDAVDAYMKALQHPMLAVVQALRKVILRTDARIGEEIKWNAPAFFYTGAMKPFNAKEYKRHIIVFNVHKPDCIRLIFPSGASVQDEAGVLTGDYVDGRRLMYFYSMANVKTTAAAMQQIIRNWLQLVI